MSTDSGHRELPSGLYVLCDDTVRPELSVVEKAKQALHGGAKVLQIRLKRTSARAAVAICREVVALGRTAGACVLVNDRVDWALLSAADGVHLGDEDLPLEDARRVLGPNALIGATTRTLADIQRAKAEGADHVGLGPIFQTATKSVPHPPLGVDGLARIAKDSPLPIVAIAGINRQNIGAVAAAGARCAAVASEALLAEDIVVRVKELCALFAP